MLATHRMHVVDPVITGQLIREDLTLNESNVRKYQASLTKTKTWSTMVDRGKILFFPFNYPRDQHWVTVVVNVVLNTPPIGYSIRVFNSLPAYAEKHNKHIAEAFAQVLFLMGVQLHDGRKLIDLTNTSYEPLVQRVTRNLCGIHCVCRAWTLSRQMESPITYDLVDTVRRLCLHQLAKGSSSLCYRLTKEERASHEFTSLVVEED